MGVQSSVLIGGRVRACSLKISCWVIVGPPGPGIPIVIPRCSVTFVANVPVLYRPVL